MAGCPIIRFEKHKTNASISGSAGHHLRTIPVNNADPDRTPQNSILMGLDTPKGIQKKVMEMTEPLVKRKDNVRCLELFLGASDEFWDSGGDWKALAEAHKAMLISEFGEKNIIGFGWHLDEGKPHGWAFVAPITPENKLSAAHWVDGPSKLKQLLTRVQPFYSPLGMERGRENVRSTHLEMHQVHAANAGNKRAKKQVDNELAMRAESALSQTKKVERKLDQARADLALVEAQRIDALSRVKAEADKLMTDAKAWVKTAEKHIDQREEKLKEQAAKNETFRRFLNTTAEALKTVFRALPEAVFLKLPDALQANLVRFFNLTPIEPVNAIAAPTPSAKVENAAAASSEAPAKPSSRSIWKP